MRDMEQTKPNPTGLPLWNNGDDPEISRRWARDLAALLALPAMWVDHDPTEIGTGLLSVLLGMLNLESAYARFDDPAGGPPLACWRPIGAAIPVELETVLAGVDGGASQSVNGAVRTEARGATQVLCLPLSLPHGNTLLLAASRNSDFPTDVEMHLLRVAVSQAVIAIYTARLVAAERGARAQVEAALDKRNAFIAALAQDLASMLPVLSGRAEQGLALLAEEIQPHTSPNAPRSRGERFAVVSQVSATRDWTNPQRLTRREVEVIGLLAQGLSNKEIAAVMWLSDRTVERHVTSLYRKIGVARRSEATAYALRHGLLDGGTH